MPLSVRLSASSTLLPAKGVYVFRGTANGYIGQSGALAGRAAQSGSKWGLGNQPSAAFSIAGGKTSREVAESRAIAQLGDHITKTARLQGQQGYLFNSVNPIGGRANLTNDVTVGMIGNAYAQGLTRAGSLRLGAGIGGGNNLFSSSAVRAGRGK